MWQITYQRPNGALWMFGTDAPDLPTALDNARELNRWAFSETVEDERIQVMAIHSPWYRLRDTENEAIRP